MHLTCFSVGYNLTHFVGQTNAQPTSYTASNTPDNTKLCVVLVYLNQETLRETCMYSRILHILVFNCLTAIYTLY